MLVIRAGRPRIRTHDLRVQRRGFSLRAKEADGERTPHLLICYSVRGRSEYLLDESLLEHTTCSATRWKLCVSFMALASKMAAPLEAVRI